MGMYGYGGPGAGVDMYERAEVEREFAREQVERQSSMLPFWNDREALRQMNQFCMSFEQGSATFSIGYWTNSALRRGRLPAPDSQAQLIKAALDAGWRLGMTSRYDLNAEFRA